MKDDLPLIDAFHDLRVLVVGEAMLDVYLDGSTVRLCREAPVPVVNLAERRAAPGGAANAAMNLAALGARVSLLSVVGDDLEGRHLTTLLESSGVRTAAMLRDPGRQTLAKTRVMADGRILVRFDQGSTEQPPRGLEVELARRLAEELGCHDAVLVSDYGYGVVTSRVVATLERAQRNHPGMVVVGDSRALATLRGVHCSAVKPNYEEACALTGEHQLGAGRIEQMTSRSDDLLSVTGAAAVVLTVDSEGALVLRPGAAPRHIPAHRAPNASVEGAGDTFSAALTLALAAGAGIDRSAELACTAAGVVVRKDGTAICTAGELRQAVSPAGKVIEDLALLTTWADRLRHDGRRIVFTNGCFDILHAGHVSYLHAARAMGDVLVVGLNTDESVRRLKGPSRPINGLEDRAGVLSALHCIDYVVPFAEDTPAEVIKALRPEVFVKGGDYTEATLPEAPLVRSLGGEIAFLPLVDDRSTSLVIERIRAVEAGATTGSDHGRQGMGAGTARAMRPAR